MERRGGDGGGGYWYGDDQVVEGTARLDANGNATIEVPAEVDDNGRDYSLRIEARVSDASNREVSGNTLAHATVGTFLVAASIDTYVARPGGTVTLSVRAVSYTGVPQAATRSASPCWPRRRTPAGTTQAAHGR